VAFPIWGRLFNYGNVTTRDFGGSRDSIKRSPKPKHIRNSLKNIRRCPKRCTTIGEDQHMSNAVRIALANLRFPATPGESVVLANDAIAQASAERVEIICFPECFVPGYRGMGNQIPPPDSAFLEHAYASIATVAGKANVAVVLGTELLVDGNLLITTLVISREGKLAGFQDKVQIDPSEEGVYSPGSERRIFQVGGVRFGVAICLEGWRYPETVRWALRRGAQIVLHPHYHKAEPGSYVPSTSADPANTFHEKAMLCRAAENTCWFASANCASPGSPTASAIVRPDGTLLKY
jgi:predicted amidohydrolase